MKSHCEVSTALKKWHIAYHGTSVGALRRTLDHSQLLPGRTECLTHSLHLSLFHSDSRRSSCSLFSHSMSRLGFRDVVHLFSVSSEDGSS